MANDSSQEKTEQPTPKRLREARKKGQVFKSKDLEAVAIFVGTFMAIAFTHHNIAEQFKSFMIEAFQTVGKKEITLDMLYALGKSGLMAVISASAPVVVTAALIAGVVGFLQVGPVFSLDPLKPQLKKLNALENFKNMFKPKQFMELVKNIIKIFVIFFLAYSVIKGMIGSFLQTVLIPIDASAKLGGEVIVRFLVRFMMIFMAVATMDIFLQRKDYIKNLKMSKDEVKREYKEDEGDPHIKSHRRQMHMEMAMGDVRGKVKNADAVVTNPTHIAVAIKYDKSEMMAPQIVAKGQRLFAEFIKEIAKENDVPIVRNVPLAWALLDLELDDEVPEKLYVAVAEILSFVYKLKEEKAGGRTAARPQTPPQPQAEPAKPKSLPQLGNRQ